MSNFDSTFDSISTTAYTGEPKRLSAVIAYYIRKLLRQNFDQLQFTASIETSIQANPLSDLTRVLESLYPQQEHLITATMDLERLALSHQALNSRSTTHRQELVDLEQQIFWLLGFKRKQLKHRGMILIIDDTPENLRLLSSALTQQGYDVRSTISGLMALTGIRNIMPDLILLDIMMPGIDGYEVCKALKAEPFTHDIPVIFISAIDDVLDKVKAFRVGGVDYITKPFEIEEVLARVENQLNIRRLQRRLEEQNERLQQEIQHRKQAEEEALKALAKEKEFSELKTRFISMVSHEFRTPLTMIHSSAELLEYYEWSEAEKRERLQQIQEGVHHMTHLLEDVLLIGKVDAGKLEPKPTSFNLIEFCHNLIAEVQLTVSNNHEIEFLSEPELQNVWLDQKLLRQIFYNLLSNAIKYSPNGGKISVAITNQENRIILQVQDHGIGIPAEDQQRLFESFHRAANVENIPGTGLGLAIVKKCVDIQAGQITFESEVGRGTTVTVTLPLSQNSRVEDG
jgi:signal transduction histidine kinase